MSDRKLVQIKKNEKPKDLRLLKLQTKLELPMLLLTFVWLATLVIELANGSNVVVSALGTTAWVLFIFYFFLRMAAIQNRVYFFKKNWIFVLAILVSLLRLFPTLQSFPLVRALTATFGMQVIWIFVSVDQGMKSIRRYVGRRGVGYALAFTFVILFAGAAGMMHFESDPTDALGLRTFPRALWWTAMQMTNIGSSYSIKTAGGRTVCLAISIDKKRREQGS
jgi:voltage-gated potassium channel